MKKVYLIIALALGFSQLSNAQAAFGIKAGVNYNSDSFQNVKDDVISGAESKTGYHAGIWVRAKIPVIGLYIRPELVYTNLSNEIAYTSIGSTQATVSDYNFQKIDVPVLLGKKIFKFGNIFAGPSFQYVLGSDFDIQDLEQEDVENFTVGLQLGAGVEFGPIGIDVRWERGFNDVESNFLDGTTSVEFDTRVNQIIVGLSYKF